jgi:calcineurin-like phosphoesterase family protein
MDSTLIRKWNERVKPGDAVYFLGDFCFKNSPGGKSGEGTTTRASHYLSQLNGNIVLFKGNHDSNNGTKSILECAMLYHGGRSIFATHIPPTDLNAVPDFCDLILCGHVHNAWKGKLLKYPPIMGPIPIINVSTDAWNFSPIEINDILEFEATLGGEE